MRRVREGITKKSEKGNKGDLMEKQKKKGEKKKVENVQK